MGNDDKMKNLSVKETTIANMPLEELRSLVKGCSAVVSCLGHNLDWHGVYHDGYFVKENAEKITSIMPEKGTRFIMMGSDGVAHPDGTTDPKRSLFTRAILGFFRMLLPPVRDQEMAAQHLYDYTVQNPSSACDWTVVRPGDLLNLDEKLVYPVPANRGDYYNVFDHPQGFLFGSNTVFKATWGISWWNLSRWKKRLFKKRTTIKCQQSTTRRTTPTKSKICEAIDRPSLEDCETNKMLRWYKLYRSNRSFIGIANEIAKQSTAYWY